MVREEAAATDPERYTEVRNLNDRWRDQGIPDGIERLSESLEELGCR